MATEGQKVAIHLHGTSDDGEDWWAECQVCEWVCTSNPDRRTAEQNYGRHHEREHRLTDR
jgi:hypothetical protein